MRQVREWSKKVTLRETLGKADVWRGEAYFDGDQHRLVLKRKTHVSTQRFLDQLAERTQRTSLTILQLVGEVSEPKMGV